MSTKCTLVDVAVIGCGPVGALAANLLAAQGLHVVVIDREHAPHPLPRAVHLDHEMMRLFQTAGLAEPLAAAMRETEGHLHVGADGGVIRYLGTAGRPKPFGWANDYFFYQPELEALLRDGLTRFDHAMLRLGAEVRGVEQDDGAVTLTLRVGQADETLRARWVIACDGARSAVRRALAIGLDDLGFEEPWLVVDAEVDGPVRFPDLWGVPDTADLQQLSVMLCDPRRPATVVPGRGAIRRWEFMVLPGEDEAEMVRPERVAALLAPFLDTVPHHVLRATTYRFHGLIAERWRDRRIFLAGDAAHQTPPFFGQGMCHGMRDVANLAWKLAAVIRDEAGEALLATYQPERDPHVRRVVAAAVEAGRYICELDPGRAAVRDETMREAGRSGGARTAADLIPAYDAGAIAAGTPGAGERFIQPRLEGGHLLDDEVGQGWRLFAADEASAAAARQARVTMAPVVPRVIAADALADGGSVAEWLARRGAQAVLVRPDHYVYGTASGRPDPLFASAHAALCGPYAEAVA